MLNAGSSWYVYFESFIWFFLPVQEMLHTLVIFRATIHLIQAKLRGFYQFVPCICRLYLKETGPAGNRSLGNPLLELWLQFCSSRSNVTKRSVSPHSGGIYASLTQISCWPVPVVPRRVVDNWKKILRIFICECDY